MQEDDAVTVDDEEAAKQAVVDALLLQIRECVGEIDAEIAESQPLSTDGLEDEGGFTDLAAEAIFLAWTMSLGWFARTRGGNVLAAAGLDESMLPPGADDAQIISMSGGLADGPFTRAVLKKLKARLPGGASLPDAVVELLKEDGITVG